MCEVRNVLVLTTHTQVVTPDIDRVNSGRGERKWI